MIQQNTFSNFYLDLHLWKFVKSNNEGEDGMKLINKWANLRWKFGMNEWKIKKNYQNNKVSYCFITMTIEVLTEFLC